MKMQGTVKIWQKSSMRKSVYLLQGKILIRNDLSSLLIQLSILRNMSSILNEEAKGIFREVDKIVFFYVINIAGK